MSLLFIHWYTENWLYYHLFHSIGTVFAVIVFVDENARGNSQILKPKSCSKLTNYLNIEKFWDLDKSDTRRINSVVQFRSANCNLSHFSHSSSFHSTSLKAISFWDYHYFQIISIHSPLVPRNGINVLQSRMLSVSIQTTPGYILRLFVYCTDSALQSKRVRISTIHM